MITRRFKRKKIFCDERTKDGWTDRHEGGNSGLDYDMNAKVLKEFNPTFEVQKMGNEAFQNASFNFQTGMRVTVASGLFLIRFIVSLLISE